MANDDNDKKGFGGFSDLVSDVSQDIATPAAEPEPAVILAQAGNTNKQPPPPTQQRKSASSPGNKLSTVTDSNFGWWLLAPVIFIAIYAVLNLENEEAAAPVPAPSYEAPYNSADDYSGITAPAPEYSEPTPSVEPAPAPIEQASSAEIPPVGDGQVFSANQIRYCHAEGIRIDTIKKAVDNYSQYEVDSLNKNVGDFNSRCSHFRYRSGTLERVQNEEQVNRTKYVMEGLKRLDSWRAP